MKKIARIEIRRDLCIGAGTCVTVTDKIFKIDEENKAVVIDPGGADDGTILIAAQSCPTAAIFLYDEEGNQIFPKP